MNKHIRLNTRRVIVNNRGFINSNNKHVIVLQEASVGGFHGIRVYYNEWLQVHATMCRVIFVISNVVFHLGFRQL